MTIKAYLTSLRRFGWVGGFGALCLLISAVLAWGLAPRWDSKTAQLEADIGKLQQRLRVEQARGQQAAAVELSGPAWLQSLPTAELRQQRLADLLDLGLRQGLVAARTEHRLTSDALSGLERLRITMPLNGTYAQLRAYIEAALLKDPALSLDGLKLRRASAQTAEMEAELQWSLHSRLAGGAR
ncbi:hypothetical protein [Pelomonas sp. SE-A7]|uniref:hypothetical protein n=1 Tax=Pelomonas sp. SE-A7 TaxID=3054953 RepID=UPI00259C91D1|nr:hypothetical protein [Pelomonas sp. SE-A7]MDM4767020.1 hypothetical protein [Pelomonas sp. SE-A7]